MRIRLEFWFISKINEKEFRRLYKGLLRMANLNMSRLYTSNIRLMITLTLLAYILDLNRVVPIVLEMFVKSVKEKYDLTENSYRDSS